MNLDYAWKLELKIWKTNIGAQKIDGFALETFEIVIADFQIENKARKPRFFQETILLANTKFEMILVIFFFKISNANVSFGKKTLMWNSYIIIKTLFTTKQVQIIDPKEFIIAVLNIDSKLFVVHVTIQEQEKMLVHSKNQAQIGGLLFTEAFTKVLMKYSIYNNVFSAENAAKLPKNSRMNEHTIELEEGKQPLFGPICSLEPIELKILKTYIKTNLANSFIRASKSPTKVPIFFDKKPNRSFHLYINYQGFNNITIKN